MIKLKKMTIHKTDGKKNIHSCVLQEEATEQTPGMDSAFCVIFKVFLAAILSYL